MMALKRVRNQMTEQHSWGEKKECDTTEKPGNGTFKRSTLKKGERRRVGGWMDVTQDQGSQCR
jgi:hypothetical protein